MTKPYYYHDDGTCLRAKVTGPDAERIYIRVRYEDVVGDIDEYMEKLLKEKLLELWGEDLYMAIYNDNNFLRRLPTKLEPVREKGDRVKNGKLTVIDNFYYCAGKPCGGKRNIRRSVLKYGKEQAYYLIKREIFRHYRDVMPWLIKKGTVKQEDFDLYLGELS